MPIVSPVFIIIILVVFVVNVVVKNVTIQEPYMIEEVDFP